MLTNSSQKEITLDISTPQKPMQKSMVQLTNQYSPRSPQSRPIHANLNLIGTLKKSDISSKESVASTIGTNNPTSFSFLQTNQAFQPLFNRQNKKMSYQQSGATTPALRSLLSSNKAETRQQSNPQNSSKGLAKTERSFLGVQQGQNANLQWQLAVQQILNQIKDKHLPLLLSKLKKEIYDDIYNLRLEFQTFKDQAFRSENKVAFSHKKNDAPEFDTQFFLLQAKIAEIQTRVSEHFRLNCDQFDRLQAKLSQHQLKNSISKGAIKSSLPPLLLEYKQVFSIQKQGVAQEVVINSATYYLDRWGNLLDSQNHYLIDRRGCQIKLDERHFKLLESHHMITY